MLSFPWRKPQITRRNLPNPLHQTWGLLSSHCSKLVIPLSNNEWRTVLRESECSHFHICPSRSHLQSQSPWLTGNSEMFHFLTERAYQTERQPCKMNQNKEFQPAPKISNEKSPNQLGDMAWTYPQLLTSNIDPGRSGESAPEPSLAAIKTDHPGQTSLSLSPLSLSL